jgi:hypothetical protein
VCVQSVGMPGCQIVPGRRPRHTLAQLGRRLIERGLQRCAHLLLLQIRISGHARGRRAEATKDSHQHVLPVWKKVRPNTIACESVFDQLGQHMYVDLEQLDTRLLDCKLCSQCTLSVLGSFFRLFFLCLAEPLHAVS